MNKKILLVGGGGHCKSVLDSLLELDYYSTIGIIDKKHNIGQEILGVSIIGCDDALPLLFSEGYTNAFVTVGSIGNPELRKKLFRKLCEIGFEIPNIVDPSAVLSSRIYMENGIYVGKNVVINAGSIIHKGAIINNGAIIEHDCLIGDFAHIAPGTVLCGEVQIGDNTHVGANSVVKQRLKIGPDSIIGMGSVVLKDIEDNTIAYGNPCKGVKSQ